MKKKQVQNQAQEGRSMVEMLGVLAIIGVLSIGGIAGYRWGMDKHVSNQILYEMNLNSAQLAMLLQKGNPDGVTLSLGSPYDDGKFRTVDYGFAYACGEEANSGHECEYLDETMYSMTATGLPKRVCNMLSDAASGLAYASELDINDGADECNDSNNTVTVFFDTDTTIEGGIPRPEESETRTPVPEVTEPTTTTTTETTTPETTTTEATTTTTTVTTTTVTTTTQLKSCEDLHCGADEFCMSGGVSGSCSSLCYPDNYQMTEAEREASSCAGTEYKCVNIGSPESQTIDEITYYYNEINMNWWSAQRYCKALQAKGLVTHGTLVSLSELGCPEGKTEKDVCAEGELLKKLKEKSWIKCFWASTPSSPCNAYNVCLGYSDEVLIHYIGDIAPAVLCK